jgi:hypothetical protein
MMQATDIIIMGLMEDHLMVEEDTMHQIITINLILQDLAIITMDKVVMAITMDKQMLEIAVLV